MPGRDAMDLTPEAAGGGPDPLPASPVSAEAATRAALARARETEALHAFLCLDTEGAVAAARRLDALAEAERGPLFGLPVAVKDNIAVRGLPSTSGSALLDGYRPPYDATAVERLRRAGAVVVGKTNLDEFGMGSSTTRSYRAPTRNPRDPERIPGGSSGGSAAAVAGGAALAALGTDTGGSVRQPAAHCGILGIRPTYGRVSRFGVTAYASSFDQVGCMAQDPVQLARVLAVIAGRDPRDATSAARPVPDFPAAAARPGLPKRIVTCSPEELRALDPESRAAFSGVVEALESGGCEVRATALPSAATAVAAYYLLVCAEASSNLARFDGMRYGRRRPGRHLIDTYYRSRSAGFGPEVRRRILLGATILSRGYRDAVYRAAARARREITAALLSAFAEGDLVLLPTTVGPPRQLTEEPDPEAEYESDRFTILAALAALPAISVPAGTRAGLPFGVQLLAPPWREELLFSAAAAFADRF